MVKVFDVLLIVLVIVSLSFVALAKGNEIDDLKEIKYVPVTVKKGDSIWSIAKRYYDGESDFRELIYNIRKLNKLDQAIIYPGQVLLIPIS
ncbi:hypothetical protein BHF71_06065 [Vulcanibacillus modesticaldus]|uniref:LysM domain-containing protein n=1 Tax=Vulcanibacillus modesticaldus TaxID=337097 RepID=A0A1D2YWX8_9BACI|nr:LysM peptidoglycan-binding domain-containing protein [Vulcanibacillus modesticaldus]OEG00166.1 hypothetical protein BHF71_06065 [Vulcanibacillus modesticaldus]